MYNRLTKKEVNDMLRGAFSICENPENINIEFYIFVLKNDENELP